MRLQKKELIFLGVILLFNLFLRLATFQHVYASNPARIMREDSPTYENPALALMKTGHFAVSVAAPTYPEVMRTPGYPGLIALTYSLVGEKRSAVIVIQILISVMTIGLTYLLGRKIWGPTVALLGTILLSFDITSFIFSQLLLSEALFSFLFLLGAYCGLNLIRQEKPSAWWSFCTGLAMAAATLTRPVSYYIFIPILFFFLAFFLLRKRPWRWLLGMLALMILPWVLLVNGWQVRNYLQTGRSELSFIRSYNLLWYRGAGIIAERDHVSLEEARRRIQQILPDITGWPVARVAALHECEAIKIMRQYPRLLIKTQIKGAINLLFGPGGSSIQDYLGIPFNASPVTDLRHISLGQYARKWLIDHPGQWLIFFGTILYLLLIYFGLALAAIGIFINWRGHIAIHIWLLGLLGYMILVSAGPEAYSRFRVPLMPWFALYATWGLYWGATNILRRFSAIQTRRKVRP